ncbi:MAG: hypothetical protein RBS80_24690, partial [Thermoguttaceae bacterium]|nr:hypothetical protein [Thermoguttaceae bacterium]
MKRILPLFIALVLAVALSAAGEPLVFETDALRLTIGEDGVVRSLTSRPEGTEYVCPTGSVPLARIYRDGRFEPSCDTKYGDVTKPWVYAGGRTFAASRVTRDGDKLRVDFAEADTTATYRVIARPEYLAMELLGISGPPADRIDLLCLKLAGLPHRGQWVNFAFDEQFGVCLCAGNVQTNAEMDQDSAHVTMRAAAERWAGMKEPGVFCGDGTENGSHITPQTTLGPVAVLFGCRDPRNRFLDAMTTVERDFGMPAGAENRRRPEQRLSYLWARGMTPDNVHEFVQLAERGGFRMIVLSYTTFSASAGHFTWNRKYPNGVADLKRVTDAIRNAGLKVGLHIHYSKASRNDPYVTPVPDDRLHQVRHFTLSKDIDATADVIPVEENPAGCTLDEQRRILKLGSELVAYESYRTEPPFAFTGCERGHLGTTTSGHEQGDALGLLNVDTWPRFIRFDQNTDIQDEVARRIGEIYRQTGPYTMVYFDGAEDVHAPFWHHVASAQQRVYRRLDPPPPVCEAALYWHFSWHMITRSNAYDVVAPAEGMKDFCRLMPCPTAEERTKDFSRINFGWLGRFGGKAPAGPDVYEYVAGRAAAWDCPISLHLALPEVEANPRAHDCLDAIRIWEDARLGNHLADAQRQSLRIVQPEDAHYVPCYDQRGIWENIQANRGLTEVQQRILANRQEHHLFINERGRYELVPIEEVPASRLPVRAYRFQRDSRPEDTYLLLWALGDDLSLHLPTAGSSVRAMRPFGVGAPAKRTGTELIVPVGNRT